MDFIPIIIALCDEKSATGREAALNMGKILERADRADDDEHCNFPPRPQETCRNTKTKLSESLRPPNLHTILRAVSQMSQRRQIFRSNKRRNKFPVQALWRTSAINAQI